jgi:hypothetical protein
MGNQAGKNKGGESGEAEAGSDDKSKRSIFGKQKFSDKISRPGAGSLNSNSSMHSWSASQPINNMSNSPFNNNTHTQSKHN